MNAPTTCKSLSDLVRDVIENTRKAIAEFEEDPSASPEETKFIDAMRANLKTYDESQRD